MAASAEKDPKETREIEMLNEQAGFVDDEYLKGAEVFKRFLLMPGSYCDRLVRLRVRFDGVFGSWRLKEELYDAFSIPVGRALFFNDLFVMGVDYSDMGDEAKHIDCFATESAAEWVLDNNITKGSVFEGTFSLEWKYVKNVAGKARIQIGANDAYIAKLILRDSNLKLISQSSKSNLSVKNEVYNSQDNVFEILSKLI
jgi:hypothetical protein